MKRLVLKSLVAAAVLAAFGMAGAQDIREHTFKFATNGAGEHPSVAGMKKFS